MILGQYVVSGTLHSMKEGLYNKLTMCILYNTLIIHLSRGGWDTEGVTVIEINTNISTITCNSTHLTSFAVLVDVSGGHQVCCVPAANGHCLYTMLLFLGYFIRRRNSSICSIICWVWNINSLSTDCHNTTSVLQVSKYCIILVAFFIVFLESVEIHY